MARLTEEARSKNILKESLAEKLKDSTERERKLEEKFRAQTRLTNLYKSQSEEHNAKVKDLGKVVTNLQNLLKESNRKQEELLDNLGKQVSDISTAGLDVSREDDRASNSQLRATIKHLRQEKDIMASRLEVAEIEKACLESQLNNNNDDEDSSDDDTPLIYTTKRKRNM